jgi:hypothetical protein
MKLKLNNPYVIVGRCLAPTLSEADLTELADVLDRQVVPWEMLLATANMNRCTPLWYVRLREHGLLDRVPEDLREYLAQLHAANVERNGRIRAELVQIVRWFNEAQIPVLLLKGAATFVDDLYKDPGARLMQDLDLLVPEREVFRAKRLLMARGYVEDGPDDLEVKDGRIVSRGHHLTSLEHAGSPVKIELHYRVLNGIGGQVLTAERAWATTIDVKLDRSLPQILDYTERLLNTVFHATLVGRNFILSRVQLSELSDFTALFDRESSRVDIERFWRLICEQRINTEVSAFTRLAQTIFRSNFKTVYTVFNSFHLSRIINGSETINQMITVSQAEQYTNDCLPNKLRQGSGGNNLTLIWPIIQKVYYYVSMPKIAWRAFTLVNENARNIGFLPFIFKNIANKIKWQLTKWEC